MHSRRGNHEFLRCRHNRDLGLREYRGFGCQDESESSGSGFQQDRTDIQFCMVEHDMLRGTLAFFRLPSYHRDCNISVTDVPLNIGIWYVARIKPRR